MEQKRFKLSKSEIQEIVPGMGGCLATDRIVVDGRPVGYMYREAPINKDDSGWRFFAGDEDSAYMSDLRRHGVYDVNTIANYDPTILRFIQAPVGSRFERGEDGFFVELGPDE